MPGTYYRLAMDYAGRFGHKPLIGSWRDQNASRYIRMFQSRRSLLVWKVFGERLDGWTNDDFPTETMPGNPKTLQLKGQPVPDTPANRNRADLDFTGSIMPPPEAVEGRARSRRSPTRTSCTLVRWIDLGCPIDLDYDPKNPAKPGYGWMLDDQRPTLTLTCPKAGREPAARRILVGMHDYGSGLDAASLSVVADFAVDGVPAGQNLAAKFKPAAPGVYEWKLAAPLAVEAGQAHGEREGPAGKRDADRADVLGGEGIALRGNLNRHRNDRGRDYAAPCRGMRVVIIGPHPIPRPNPVTRMFIRVIPMSTPKSREFTASTHGELQPTLIVLENLLDALTETTSSAPAVRATVQAIRAGTGADIAFWHSRLGAKTTVWPARARWRPSTSLHSRES